MVAKDRHHRRRHGEDAGGEHDDSLEDDDERRQGVTAEGVVLGRTVLDGSRNPRGERGECDAEEAVQTVEEDGRGMRQRTHDGRHGGQGQPGNGGESKGPSLATKR